MTLFDCAADAAVVALGSVAGDDDGGDVGVVAAAAVLAVSVVLEASAAVAVAGVPAVERLVGFDYQNFYQF